MMKLYWIVSVSIVLLAVVNPLQAANEEGKKKKGKLQIGIRKKIEPHNCHVQTRLGDTVEVHFYGALLDGTEFDDSWKRDEPLVFTFGGGTVIKGFEQGLLDMCIGEKRKLVVPPELGYGPGGTSGVPGDATLVYEVELLKNHRPFEDEL